MRRPTTAVSTSVPQGRGAGALEVADYLVGKDPRPVAHHWQAIHRGAFRVDVMAELARQTHVPVATGERIFTKWGFREVLEKRAATIVQPDVCYAGGITELRLIAGMAESYYTPMAPHNPQGPCSLAASLQIAARIPNFLAQEGGDHEYLDLLAEPLPPVVGGYRLLPTAPGLGITIDEDKLSQVGEPHPYRVDYDADDGSVVDW